MQWSKKQDEKLKTLWESGLTCRQIARQLPELSGYADGGRSAVIGRLYRIGCTGRTGERPKVKRVRVTTPFGGQRKAKATTEGRKFAGGPVAAAPGSKGGAIPVVPDIGFETITRRLDAEIAARTAAGDTKNFMDLDHGDGCCRYVIGEPAKLRVCGRTQRLGRSYCPEHDDRCLPPAIVAARKPMVVEPMVVETVVEHVTTLKVKEGV